MSATATWLRLGPEKTGPEPRDHGVDFCDATAVFDDRFARPLADRVDAATGELRLRLIGHTKDYVLIIVAFVEREDEGGHEVIRIIGEQLDIIRAGVPKWFWCHGRESNSHSLAGTRF